MSEPTRIKADIIPFSLEYASLVRSWIDSEETYFNVCRGKEFPPPDEIVETWQRQGVSSYLLVSENKPIAYGELWRRPLEMAMEICHVIVDPYKRSRGYGTKILTLLYDRAAQQPDLAKVVINLYSDDEIALGCYLKAGFSLAGTSNYTVGLKMLRMVK